MLTLHPDSDEITSQRWTASQPGPNRPSLILRSGHPTLCSAKDFASRCTHRLLFLLAHSVRTGEIRAELPKNPNITLTAPPSKSWINSLRPLLPATTTWSIYTDASWKADHPIQAEAVFALQGTHCGGGALFLSADTPDCCSNILAAHFDIPPTLRALGGTAQVAELIAIHAGLHLLHSFKLRGTVYSDCLSAYESYSPVVLGRHLHGRRRGPHLLQPFIPFKRDTFRMAQRASGARRNPRRCLVPTTLGYLHR